MVHQKLILLILIPAMLAGQSGELSQAARKLVTRPRVGEARLTLSDGRTEDGRILQITDHFLTFRASQSPFGCEDIEISRVAAVHWLSTQGIGLGDSIYYAIILAPFFAGYVIVNVFRGMSTPPLQGRWESVAQPGVLKSTLEFNGSTVKARATAVRHGHYSVSGGSLHMMFDGTSSEIVIPFQMNCGALILHGSGRPAIYSEWPITSPASDPIVGEWHNIPWSALNLKSDGSFEEQKEELRQGTFERTSKGVNIHWADDQGPGGPEWSAQIKHRHLVVRLGPVVTEYRYVR